MSAEFRTVDGRDISVTHLHIGEEEVVDFGNYEFDRTEFNIGILEFLAGKKRIQIGSVFCKIPDSVDQPVDLGHLQLSYRDFVTVLCWELQTGGDPNLQDEFQLPRRYSVDIAIYALEKYLWEHLPEANETLRKTALQLRQEHVLKGGIRGLRTGVMHAVNRLEMGFPEK